MRLFWRAFLAFWLTMTLIGASFALLSALISPARRIEQRRNLGRHAIRLEAAEVMEEASRGEDAIGSLERFYERTDVVLFLFTEDGAILAPKPPPQAAHRLAERVRREGDLEREKDSAVLVGFLLADGHTVAVGRFSRTPGWARALGTETLPLRLLVIAVFSAIVSLVLARYLSQPLRSLRRATQQIAEGDLSVRVGSELGSTDPQIAALGRDFDAMASRVEELLQAQRRLLSDVSHELSSPLARLRVALELARAKAGEGAQAPLDRIEREAERLGLLIREILTLERLERGGPSDVRELDLAALVEAVASDADYEGRSRGRRVTTEGAERCLVLGDPELLRRAIENVVRNAVRFTAEGTEVEVALARTEGAVALTVRDRGPGVPEDALPHIFEPLYRVHADRDRKTGGAGLGLAITERAMLAHGGSVAAENAPGGGLVVTLTLPGRA